MVQQKSATRLDTGLEVQALPRRVPGWLDVLRRLVREKPLGLIGGLIVVAMAVAAIGASFVPYGPNELAAGPRLIGPTAAHPLGTDNLGRDVFARVLNGAQVSMWVGFLSVVTSILSFNGNWHPERILRRLARHADATCSRCIHRLPGPDLSPDGRRDVP